MKSKRKILELSNVYKTYQMGDTITNALNGVDLEVVHGEVIVILGSSGSGKTTLLNVLSGLDRPTSGKIYFEGRDITRYSEGRITKFRKDNLGFIFQTYNLLEHLNVKENIKVGAVLGKNKANIGAILSTVGLTRHANKYMHELSGGEQQRVSIARALAKNPKIMFADEPTGALDEETGKKVLRALIDANEKMQTTMIIVTHNPGIALIGDKVIRVNSGEISSVVNNNERTAPEEIPWG